jgi:uncharacterized protein
MSAVVLLPGDEPRVERFLLAHADSSLFLRSNLRAAGLVFEDKRLQGTWVAEEEQGELTGIVCHAWNGNLLFQAPRHAAQLAAFARQQSGRKVEGLVGPWEQVQPAREALKLDETPPSFSSLEHLFALSLAELRVPSAPGECRRVAPEDFEAVVEQRAAFVIEALGGKPSPSIRSGAEALVAEGSYFVVRHEGRVVASGCFNARLPDCVQLGGIYTPPEDRNRGYARQLVAGMLLAARGEGVTRAVLFTDEHNAAAQRAYEAIGFRRIGEYGLVLWTVS